MLIWGCTGVANENSEDLKSPTQLLVEIGTAVKCLCAGEGEEGGAPGAVT
jgi:hypothetical protein